MLNFNVEPYYDDFDPNNNFHRILFKPGRAVQARELTQSQTIQQDQITKFADHIFKQNTPVKGGQVTIDANARYVKLNPTFNDADVVASDFLNQIVTDSTGTILAKVVATAEATPTESPTLVLNYLSGSEFTDGDSIISTSSALEAQAVPLDATGSSSVASISEGVFYIVNGYSTSSVQNDDGTYSKYSIGNFVSLQPQTIILSKYDNTPTKRVGLTISEYVTDYVIDPGLLDPAVSATNYQAPGADRYTIKLNLDTKNIDFGSDDDFIELVRVTDGKIQRLVDGTVYGVIDDYFAKRTFDTNGDFVVNDFKLTPTANTINSDKFVLQVGTGVAYIRGYRVESTLDNYLDIDRARTTETVNNSAVNIDYGNYLYVNNANGVFDVTSVAAVDFHCINVNTAIVTTNTTTYNSTKVGSGFIRALTFDSNSSDSNTATYVYKAYVSDISTRTLSSTAASTGTANTITFADSTGKFSSVANAYYGVSLTIDSGTSAGDKVRIVSYNGSTKTATVDPAFTVIPDTSSHFSLRFARSDIDLVTQTGTVANSFTASAGVDVKSKSNGLTNGSTVLKDTNSPELLFNVGYNYVSTLSDSGYDTQKVFRDINFNTTTGGVLGAVDTGTDKIQLIGDAGTTQGADTVKDNYTVIVTDIGTSNFKLGEVLNFTGTSTISLAADKGSAELFVPSSTAGGEFTATVITNVHISDANNTSVALKYKNLMEANTTNVNFSGTTVAGVNVDLTNGQVYIPNGALVAPGKNQKLYVSDVKRIVKIIDTKAVGQTPTDAMLTDSTYDVTDNYFFSTGQRDSYYGHAYITSKLGAPKPQGNLLVIFDYYQHAGGTGYFSVQSYRSVSDGGKSIKPESYTSIPSYTSSNGTVYNLRDCIDFRPVQVNAQTDLIFGTFTGQAGVFIPNNSSQFDTDYTHYLGRKDLIILTKDNSFEMVTGTPSNAPQFPSKPDGSLSIAALTLEPYTSFIPEEAPVGVASSISLEKIQHKRWTMSDISDLQTRINNIEYYTALSQLEKDAEALQVRDSFGLNRFKNGILVDNFTGASTAQTGSVDYAAKINNRLQFMTAADEVLNLPIQSQDILKSMGNLSRTRQSALGYRVHSIGNHSTNIFTLPYTTANLVTQKIASNTVSLNPFAVELKEGVLEINPPMDTWVSTTKEPDVLIVDPKIALYSEGSTLNTLQQGDWQNIPGTTYSVTTYSGDWATKNTYVNQSKQVVSGNFDKVSSITTNVITDVSLLPYIRSQEILLTAKGLKVNSPVSVFFDGVNVDEYLTLPNAIELKDCVGKFKEGQVIGYLSGGTFTVIGNVTGATKVSTGKYRLYITNDLNTEVYTTTNIVRTAEFDENGNFINVDPVAYGVLDDVDGNTIHVTGKANTIAVSTSSSTNDGGSTLYKGVTEFTLNSKASSIANYYVGATITVSTWTNPLVGKVYTPKKTEYTRTITAYDATTKKVTLNSAIQVTLGTHKTAGNVTSTYSIKGTSYLMSKAIVAQGVPKMSADETGKFCAILNIPGDTFKTGDRMIRIDNRSTDTDPESSTTFAQSIFSASSLALSTQSISYGATVSAAAKNKVFKSQAQRNNVLIASVSWNTDPVAQTFIFDKETYPNGVFASSIKVFFRTKPTASVPVKLFLTDTINGYPDGQAIDNTVVVKEQADVNVSTEPHYLDPEAYTEFVFDAPVYLKPGNLYSFILQTTSSEYTIWTAAQNAVAVPSSVKVLPTDAPPTAITKIGAAPYIGGLFESQNGITWTADQSKSMMFTIERCVFNTASAPSIQFTVPKRLPTRKIISSDVDYFKNANTAPDINNFLYSQDFTYDALNISTSDFVPSKTNITYRYTPTLASDYTTGATKYVSPGKNGTTLSEHIYLDDGKRARVLDSNSATSFALVAQMTTTDSAVSPVLADDGLSLYAIKNVVNNMGLANTDITVSDGGSGYTSATVTISRPTGIGGTQAYAVANVVGGVVDAVYITTPGSGYIETPTISITGSNTGIATAIVGGETSASGGNGLSRYITKKVVLSPGNDSSDLRVFFTAYRPLGSSINVYYKVLSRSDTTAFEDQNWVLMTGLNNSSTYSANRDALYEYEYAPGSAGVADNQLTYTNTAGETYDDFSQFAIKIVIATSDSTKTPFLKDLRVLALPSGTGM